MNRSGKDKSIFSYSDWLFSLRSVFFLTAVLIALFVWIFDPFVDAVFLGDGSFYKQLTQPESKEIYMRTVFSVLIIVIGLVGSVLLNRSRQAEKILHKSEKKYREIFENVRDVFYQTDYHGIVTEISPSVERHSGYTREALIGAQLANFYFYPDDYLKLCDKLEEDSEVNDFEIRMKDKDGGLIYVSVNAQIIFDAVGNPVATEGTLRDITERKRAEEEKIKLEAQLHHSQKLETLGTLAGGIAHDFNNILTPILGYADMVISDLPPTSPLRDDVGHILSGANRAKELVEQILLFSKQVEKERKPFSLHLILKEVLKLLRPTIPATVEIRQRIDTSCDKVLADASQMHQVIVNLCTNAWQAMEEKGGVLTIELKQTKVDTANAKLHINLNEQEYVRLTVSDTGAGIDDAILERIFEPFFTTKSVDKGTGMGLAVVHGIVRSHHGDILVNSVLGKGSTFHVYLPTINTEVESVTNEPEVILGNQESVLVVDDDEAVGKVMQRLLQHLNYKADVRYSGIEALKIFRQRPEEYDLVISDLTMPDMTGLELSEQLRNVCSELPVIIMTGYGDSLTDAALETYGIKHVIGKPVVTHVLASAIRLVLDK